MGIGGTHLGRLGPLCATDMKTRRTRTRRRAEARAAAKELDRVRREFFAMGVADRVHAVNLAVAPNSPLFWRTFKDRIVAREFFGPLRDLEAARGVAIGVLRELGFDLAGIVLKPDWQPPILRFEAQVEHQLAVKAVETVRGRWSARN